MKLLYTIKKGGKGKFKKEVKKNQAIWQPQVAHSNKQVAYTNKPSDIWCITDREPCLKTRVCYNKRKLTTYSHLEKIINGNRDRICSLQVLQNWMHWISDRLDKI